MCGVAGIIGGGDPALLEAAAGRLARAMAHRGPDSQGAWTSPRGEDHLRLIHTRLAIIDLSPAGAQPMVDPATGNAIAFNGEIYNFKALRREIEAAWPGASFFSHSDTEVLLRGYALWGESLFSRLDGMFALLLYDRAGRRLIVARDHVGIKPLYYAKTVTGGLVFASEVRAIKASGLAGDEVNFDSLFDYLTLGSICEPHTILSGVYAFPAAHYAVIDLSARQCKLTEPVRYWNIAEACLGASEPGPAAAEHARILTATVADQLMADVPVGLFLSGGIDSTVLAEAVPIEVRPRLHAFTVSRRSKGASEAMLAARTAQNLGIRHTVCDLGDEEVLAWMRQGLMAMDQPSHDGVNIFIVSKASRQAGIIVALCGAGADELHGGYGHFATLAGLWGLSRLPGLLPILRVVIPPLAHARSGLALADRARLLLAAAPDLPGMVNEKRRYFTPGQIQSLWPQARRQSPGDNLFNKETFHTKGLAALSQISLAEISGYLKNTLLRDADWAAMANHQELRVPYLGKAYMETVLSLPWSVKTRRGRVNKPLLADMISAQNRHVVERAKTGFELDYGRMLAGPLRDEFFEAASILNSGFGFALKPEALLAGLGEQGADKSARRVFALYALGSYLGRHGG